MEIIIDQIVGPLMAIVIKVILAAIGAAAATGGAMFIRWINRKTQNDTLTDYASMLVFFAEKAVKNVAQTMGDEMKAVAADGKFSESEKRQLKDAAMATLKAIAPDAILNFMEKGKSDLDMLLSTLIESAVKDSKGGNDA